MAERIHDVEADTSESIVRALLGEQCALLSGLPLTYLRSSGTSNAMWRLHRPDGPDLVARLPRTEGAARSVDKEIELLPWLAASPVADAFGVPRLAFEGEPAEAFPYRWAILEWIEGVDAWASRYDLDERLNDLAIDLAAAVLVIRSVTGAPVPSRRAGQRGGPLGPLLERLDQWLADPAMTAEQLVDVVAVRRCAAECAEVVDEPIETGFVHGDLIPGNVLLRGSRLSAIVDWGGAGYGDVAQDLSPAWAIFDRPARTVFRQAVAADDAAWLRARAFDLEQAVGGVLYYTPRAHPLADVMARTLERVLTE